jgi:hypothetical protein
MDKHPLLFTFGKGIAPFLFATVGWLETFNKLFSSISFLLCIWWTGILIYGWYENRRNKTQNKKEKSNESDNDK